MKRKDGSSNGDTRSRIHLIHSYQHVDGTESTGDKSGISIQGRPSQDIEDDEDDFDPEQAR
jgi:hypothetical protein